MRNRVIRFAMPALMFLAACFAFAGPAFASVTSIEGHWELASTAWLDESAGTASNPYVIATSADLAGLAVLVDERNTFRNKYIVLAADIDLEEREWEPIGWFDSYFVSSLGELYYAPFEGTFDGRGYKISGLWVNEIWRDGALFGYIGSGGTVRNLRLEGAVYSPGNGSMGAAGLTAWLDGAAENCVISADLTAGTGGYRSYSGMVASIGARGSARNIVTYGTVVAPNGYSYAGGIVGYSYSSPLTIENCVTEASSLTALQDAGGIVGGNLGNCGIYNCVSAADYLEAAYVGGVTAVGNTGENNFWLRENENQPEFASSYGGAGGTAGRKSLRAELPVVAAEPMRAAYVKAGETVNIAASLHPAGGDASGLQFTWMSGNPGVATLGEIDGPEAEVTGVSPGATTISFSMRNPDWKGRGSVAVNCVVYVYEDGTEPGGDPGVEPVEPVEPDEPEIPDVGDEPKLEDSGESTTTAVTGDSRSAVAALTGLPASAFSVDSAGNLTMNSVEAAIIAKETWPDETIDVYKVTPLPIPWGSVSVGEILALRFSVKGSRLYAETPRGVRVMKVKHGEIGDSFAYTDTPSGADKRFTVMKDGYIHTGDIAPDDTYTLVLYVKDGGGFDLDPAPGSIIDPAVVIKSEKRESSNEEDKSGGGGGCSAASGAIPLIISAAVFAARKRRAF